MPLTSYYVTEFSALVCCFDSSLGYNLAAWLSFCFDLVKFVAGFDCVKKSTEFMFKRSAEFATSFVSLVLLPPSLLLF